MAINKYIITIMVLLIVGLSKQTKGQTIKIQSFDEKNQTIKIVHDSDRDKLTIATLKDTLYIDNCIAMDEARILNKYFVKIIYRARGGTGISLKHMIILTAKSEILYETLHITSLFDEKFIDYNKAPTSSTPDKKSLYEVKIKSFNADYKNQKMVATVHSSENTKDNPQNSHNNEIDIPLNFDTVRNIFYSSYAKLSHWFSFYDAKTQKENKQKLTGQFPFVKLGKYQYYYIGNAWYEKKGIGGLSKYSFR